MPNRKKRAKILCVVGARPNFVKLAPLAKSLRACPQFVLRIVHTGQHYDLNMSDWFFRDLHIPDPDFSLDVGSSSHSKQTARIMVRFERVCLEESPDLVIVLGDVNSTLACALTAVKLNIKVAHVEAGLRSHDKTMPEEVNRVLTDHCSEFLFAPTPTAAENLKREGIQNGVFMVGDVMADVLMANRGKAKKRLDRLKAQLDLPAEYVLATLHRPKNVDHRNHLEAILRSFSGMRLPVVWPLHPRARKRLRQFRIWGLASTISDLRIVEPLGYLDMLALETHARLIITDSGGMQKEACLLGRPCLTLREQTEWVETLGHGNRLVAVSEQEILSAAEEMMNKRFSCPENLYGRGDAARKIAEAIVEILERD